MIKIHHNTKSQLKRHTHTSLMNVFVYLLQSDSLNTATVTNNWEAQRKHVIIFGVGLTARVTLWTRHHGVTCMCEYELGEVIIETVFFSIFSPIISTVF